jgi:hypothetical protein
MNLIVDATKIHALSSRYTSKIPLMQRHSQRHPSVPEVKSQSRSLLCNNRTFRRGAKKRRTELGVKVQNQRIKWQALVIAASGIVTLGALAAAIGQQQTATAVAGHMNIGGTTTSTTPPMTEPTAIAHPIMKAQRPKGF